MTWSTVALSHMYHQIEEVCIKSILTAENTASCKGICEISRHIRINALHQSGKLLSLHSASLGELQEFHLHQYHHIFFSISQLFIKQDICNKGPHGNIYLAKQSPSILHEFKISILMLELLIHICKLRHDYSRMQYRPE